MAPFFSEPSQTGMGRQISSLLSELFADRWLGLSGVTLIRIIATVDMEMDPVEMEFLYRSCEKVYVTTYVSKECAGENVQKHFTPHAPDAYLQAFLLEVFRPWDICIWLARSSKKTPIPVDSLEMPSPQTDSLENKVAHRSWRFPRFEGRWWRSWLGPSTSQIENCGWCGHRDAPRTLQWWVTVTGNGGLSQCL